jgi:hypothetical protein
MRETERGERINTLGCSLWLVFFAVFLLPILFIGVYSWTSYRPSNLDFMRFRYRAWILHPLRSCFQLHDTCGADHAGRPG